MQSWVERMTGTCKHDIPTKEECLLCEIDVLKMQAKDWAKIICAKDRYIEKMRASVLDLYDIAKKHGAHDNAMITKTAEVVSEGYDYLEDNPANPDRLRQIANDLADYGFYNAGNTVHKAGGYIESLLCELEDWRTGVLKPNRNTYD